MLPTKEEVGKRLKDLRGERSMAEVAKALGITRQAWWKYESGDSTPSDETKSKIAEYFGVSVNMIFFISKS